VRPELERLLHLDWRKETEGANVHIQSILDLKPTATERKELCSLLENTQNSRLAMVWTAIMGKDPRPEYHHCLKKILDKQDPQIVYHATWALIDGEYPDALEIVFSNEKVQQALGDNLGGRSGRVAPGDCSPGAPADPYVQNYRIRFLK